VVGSEMSGGVRNIFVTDCTFIGTDKGIRFKTARGRGGIVENIFIRNIMMKDIQQEAIFFDAYYFMKAPGVGEKQEIPPVTEATPQFRDILIDHVVCSGADKGIFMRGLPEMPVKNIAISNCVLNAKKSSEFSEAKDIVLNKVRLVVAEGDPIKADKKNTNLIINKQNE
jgi:polygalacturonase